jgi:hypothetical protein
MGRRLRCALRWWLTCGGVSLLLLSCLWLLPAATVRAAGPVVTSCSDAATHTGTSLRDAIGAANSGDTITFAAGLNCPADGPITLTQGTLTVDKNLTIDGTGVTIAVDGSNAVTVLSVSGAVTAQITALTIQHGKDMTGTLEAGGVYNSSLATLIVTNCTITGNSASYGGIRNRGTLTVTNSTITGNSASTGGGIDTENNGTLTVTNSTISGNSAASAGGGIFAGSGTLTVTNSTLSGNSVTGANSSGGGIYNAGTAMLTNTIVASSTGGDLAVVSGGTFTGAHNLIDDTSDTLDFHDGTNGNIVNHPALLGTLGGYGSTNGTQTVPLLPGSPAIDAGDDTTCSAAVPGGAGGKDQRGIARPQGTHCDIGAFESHGFTLTRTGGDGQFANLNTPFAAPLAVSVASGYGEPVNGGIVTFTVTPGGGGQSATLGTPNPATIASGAGSVTATANGTAGAYTVIAAITGAPSVSFSLTNAGPAVRIVASAGTPQAVQFNTPFGALTATVTDAAGSPMSGLSVTFTVTPAANGASGTFTGGLSSVTVLTNASGVATAPTCTANGTAGSYGVSADLTASPLGTPATFALTNTAGSPAHVVANSGTPQSALVTTAFGADLVATVTDAGGNPVSSVRVTFTVTPAANGASATLTAPAVTDANGMTSVKATANGTPGGPYTVTAAANGVSGTATFQLTNTAPVVNSTGDGPANVANCAPSNANTCRLRDAIAAMNGGVASGTTIAFDIAGGGVQMITVSSALPALTASMTIDGTTQPGYPTTSSIVVDGNSKGSVFTVNSGATVALRGLTIQHGSGTGGAGCIGYTTCGGGIFNNGTLTVTNSTVSGNSALGRGGGIMNYYYSTLTVTNSTVSGNSASDDGGGIDNYYSTLTVTNSIFSGNSSTGGGGIDNAAGTVTVTNSTLSGNSTSNPPGGGIGGGGGIRNDGTLIVTSSTLSGNRAGVGGGIANDGTLTVTNSTLSGNSASSGGGIYTESGTANVTNSTLAGNSASSGGGIRNEGTLTVTNSTLSGNTANSNGGGIFAGKAVTLTNTVVANTMQGGDLSVNGASVTFAGMHNLIDDADKAGGLTDGMNGNIVGHPALLGSLASNGGPTLTIPLNTGSPAIAHGDPAVCAAAPVSGVDQRGVTRPGSVCAIGAFEPLLSAIAPTAGVVSGGTSIALTGAGFANGATVTVGGVACGDVQVANSTTLHCTTGAHAVGAVDVVVAQSGQTGTLVGAYTYQAAAALPPPKPGGPAGGVPSALPPTRPTGPTNNTPPSPLPVPR